MKYLLAFLLLPLSVLAQEQKTVEPVKSGAYQRLIAADTTQQPGVHIAVDTFGIRIFAGVDQPIKHIKYHKKDFSIDVKYPQQLRLSGSYRAFFSLRQAGKQPALQKTYAQGRSTDNGPSWAGPESNELFSYGPALANLEYDGTPTPYDKQGSLVPKGQGKGIAARPYTNSIFRTATSFEQQFNLQARIMNYNVAAHELKLGFTNQTEKTFIQQNNNRNYGLTTNYIARIKWLQISAKYSHAAYKYDNSNRNGFLNKVYQQSILTPPTFNNADGYLIGNMQRRFNNQVDNPYFLLTGNGNYLNNTHHQGSLALNRGMYSNARYTLIQSFEINNSRSREAYKPFSANWPGGNLLDRKTTDKNYEISGEFEKKIDYGRSDFSGRLTANLGLSNVQSTILNGPTKYFYQRTANESRVYYRTSFKLRHFNFDLDAGNKTYISNTTNKRYFLLPQGALDVWFDFARGWDFRIGVNYSDAVTERSINQSYAYADLTRLNVDKATTYFPVTEVNSFDGLTATRHKDAKVSFTVTNSRLEFTAYLYNKNVMNDVAPLVQGGQLKLANVGDHNTRGIDLSLRYSTISGYFSKFYMTNELLFSTYKTKVTRVETGYDRLALHGFSDLHTSWIEGMPMNVIVGSAWTRNADGQVIVGNEGYPFRQKDLQVIGDPNPDFIAKYINTIRYKHWTFSTALEWKKGGEKWNGTQAILDYYGVSASSGDQRNVKGYVFEGVNVDNEKNTRPVNFYDPKADIYENRWVRYGPSGIGEAYVQKADWLKIRDIKLSYNFTFKKIISQLETGVFVSNLLLWTPYKGTDPEQLLFDMPGTQGLDYFNLPAVKTLGVNVSIQF